MTSKKPKTAEAVDQQPLGKTQLLPVILINQLFLLFVWIFGSNSDIQPIVENFALIVMCFFSLCACAENSLIRRLDFVALSWTGLFGALLEEPSLRVGFTILAASTLTQMIYVVAVLLCDKMATYENSPINLTKTRGLAQTLPEHSGILMTLLLLLSSIPGSAFFLLEDLGIATLISHSWIDAFLMLLGNILIAASMWTACSQVLYGRHPGNASFQEETGLTAFRLALGFLLVCNLGPFMWII